MPLKFEEDDTVVYSFKRGCIGIGLVSEVYAPDASSEDESDDEEDDLKLKPGQISVEWYPSGKETVVYGDTVRLVDRTLLLGELVRSHELNKIGFVYNVNVSCDVALLPFRQLVIKNVTDSRIKFVQKFGGSNAETKYILFDKWIGLISNVSYQLTLRSFCGYRCTINVGDETTGIKDGMIRCVQDSTFDDKQWYAGQVIKCPYSVLSKASWTVEPPQKILKRFSMKNKWKHNYITFIVEKVDTYSLNVRWLSAIGGFDDLNNAPSDCLQGDDVQKVQLLPYVEHQFLQIGDRITLNVTPSDELVSMDAWRSDLRQQIIGASRTTSLNTDIDENSKQNKNKNSENTTTHQNTKSLYDFFNKRNKSFDKDAKKLSDGNVSDDENDSDWADCSNTDAEDASDKKHDASSSRGTSGKVRCSLTPPVKKMKLMRSNNVKKAGLTVRAASGCVAVKLKRGTPRGPRVSSASKNKENEKLETANAFIQKYQPSSFQCAETMFTRSCVDVIWQDGTISEKVPTAKLCYADMDLDEHVFFPGSFVRLQEAKKQLWPPNGYGVVERVNPISRLAFVSWYEIVVEGDKSILKLIKAEDVSVFELVAENDYNYQSGSLVTRILTSTDTSNVYVGQILYINVQGMIVVCWANGQIDNVYPFELCKLGNDDTWSDHQEDDSANSETSAFGSNDDSWDTIDESSCSSSDSSSASEMEDEEDGVRAHRRQNATPENAPENDLQAKIAAEALIVTKLKHLPTKIRDSIVALRKIANSDVRIRIKLATSVLRIYRLFFILHKNLCKEPETQSLDSTPFNADLKTCITKLKEWLKLAASSKRRRRLDELLSSSDDEMTPPQGRDLLGFVLAEVDKLAKTKLEINGEESEVNNLSNASSTSNDSKTKSDGGLGEVLHVFVKQVGHFLSKFGKFTRSASDVAQLDRLMKEIRENPLIKEVFAPYGQPYGSSSSEHNSTLSEHADSSVSGDSGIEQQTLESLQVPLASSETLDTTSSSSTQESEFIQRLVDAQLAADRKSGIQNCVYFMDFMALCMSAIVKSRTTPADNFYVEDTPDGMAQVAKVDVIMVSALIILQLNIATFCESLDFKSLYSSMEPVLNDDQNAGDDGRNQEVENDADNKTEEHLEVAKDEKKTCDDNGAVATESCSFSHFEYLESPPSDHSFIEKAFTNDIPGRFMRAVREDIKILQSSLAKDAFVKAFEKRADLLSVMIRGAPGTPYLDGLFLFDVQLRSTYPQEPPLVFYKSFASEKLNPNLYEDGKVCVSLLGTWNGKDSEVWNPGSNLLQVILSIQGLILNSEPYYNEAGYEARRVVTEYDEKSRSYNEMVIVRNLENLINIASQMPPPFEKEIEDHMRTNGLKIIERLNGWMSGEIACGFPLQPVSLGCVFSVKKQLEKLESLINEKFRK